MSAQQPAGGGGGADERPVKQIRVPAETRVKLERLFEHFDKDYDEHLNSTELNNLQVATAGQGFENNAQYAFVCKLLDMNPFRGLNFAAFTRVYLDDDLPFDADIDADYKKLFENDAGADAVAAADATGDKVEPAGDPE